MADFPQQIVTPISIHSFSPEAVGSCDMRGLAVTANPASAAWAAANQAIYIPIEIRSPYLLALFFWGNGSTASSNCDVGLYTVGGSRIASTGSTAQSGASAVQYAAPSAGTILVSPGQYYLGFACSGTTNRVFQNTSVTAVPGRMMGLLQESSALPLPATMTPVAFASTGYPLTGIARR